HTPRGISPRENFSPARNRFWANCCSTSCQALLVFSNADWTALGSRFSGGYRTKFQNSGTIVALNVDSCQSSHRFAFAIPSGLAGRSFPLPYLAFKQRIMLLDSHSIKSPSFMVGTRTLGFIS